MSTGENQSSVIVPPRRNNGETVEERMTTNAWENILPRRYQKKNRQGNYVEERGDIFERVAKNLAVAEAAHVDSEVTVTPDYLQNARDSRVEEFAEAVFGTSNPDEDATAVVTEKNAFGLRYEAFEGDEVFEVMEAVKNQFQEQIENLNLMPNTPTIVNAGNDMQMLSACFVISPEDDMRDIHETVADASEIFQAGGGVGYDFSQLRPYGDKVGGSGRPSTGPLAFMRTFDQACASVSQAGVRRGAQMGIMRVDHPDVLMFINSKRRAVSLVKALALDSVDDTENFGDFGQAYEEAQRILEEESDEEGRLPSFLRNAIEDHLSNFNISVAVTDEFMDAVRNDEMFTFENPQTQDPHIASPETKEMYEWFGLGEYVTVGDPLEVPAREIWDQIGQGAHEIGEPGIVYLDRINRDNSFDAERGDSKYINATNPCGEEPLFQHDACNLAHANLSTLVAEDAEYQIWSEYRDDHSDLPLDEAIEEFLEIALDTEKFESRIETGMRLLDNVVTMSDFPIEEINKTVRNNRKVGLGIMGLAQLFVQLGISYGSEESEEITRQLMTNLNHKASDVTHQLAKERGSFAEWDESKYADPTEYPEWFEQHTGEDPSDWEDGYPVRNHKKTTIAPTGTTSMLANTTGGCEPMYNVAYYKNVSPDVQGDEMLVEFDQYFLDVLEANSINIEEVKREANELMSTNQFTGVSDLETVPDEIGELFITTQELTPKQHASVQCAAQEGVDSAISKTLNAPNNSTVDDALEVMEYVYDHGGKGVTYYRDGSRSNQVLTTRKDNVEFAEDSEEELLNRLEEHFSDEGFRQEVADLFLGFGEGTSPEEMIEDLTSGVVGDIDAQEITPQERPKTLSGASHRVNTGYGKLYVTINVDEYGRPMEVFVNIGESGSLIHSFTEALATLISMALRSGVSVDSVIDQLKGIRSPKIGWDQQDQIYSIPDGIATALERYMNGELEQTPSEKVQLDSTIEDIPEQTETATTTPTETDSPQMMTGVDEMTQEDRKCPLCNDYTVIMQEGCKKCSKDDCEFSLC